MERRLKKKEPQYGWIAVAAIVVFAVVIYLLLPYSVFGATYEFRDYTQSGYHVDSAWVVRWDVTPSGMDSIGFTVYNPSTDSNTIAISVTVNDTVTALLQTFYKYHNYTGYYPAAPVYWTPRSAMLGDSTTFQGAASLDTTQIILAMSNNFGSGPYGSSAGDGGDTVIHYAYDSGNAELVARAHLVVKNAAGNEVTNTILGPTGIFSTGYTNGNTYTVIVEGPHGYAWASHSFTVDISGQPDTAYGYNYLTIATAPSDTGLCTVYGYMGDLRADSVGFEEIGFSIPNKVYNSCTDEIIPKLQESTRSRASGYFEITLVKSSCLTPVTTNTNVGDSVWYSISLDGVETTERLYIPADSSTYKLVF